MAFDLGTISVVGNKMPTDSGFSFDPGTALLINAGVGLTNGLMSAYSANRSAKKSYKYSRWLQQHEQQYYRENLPWATEGTPQWTVAGLRKANLNPILAAQSGLSASASAYAPSSGGVSVNPPTWNLGGVESEGSSSYSLRKKQEEVFDKQMTLLDSQIEKTKGESRATWADAHQREYDLFYNGENSAKLRALNTLVDLEFLAETEDSPYRHAIGGTVGDFLDSHPEIHNPNSGFSRLKSVKRMKAFADREEHMGRSWDKSFKRSAFRDVVDMIPGLKRLTGVGLR